MEDSCMNPSTTLRTLGAIVMTLLLWTLSGCQGIRNEPSTGGGSNEGSGSLETSVNHIVFLVQENRSLDHYFGAMRQYWKDFGYPDQAFDGLPQFPNSSPSGAPPTNM